MNHDQIEKFKETVWAYYAAHGRDLPWRNPNHKGSFDPYHILVSELMLQQTQVNRVIPKYALFLETFPSVGQLAAAPLADVLIVWSGLGYNRRAKFLHEAAKAIVDLPGGFPKTRADLVKLPGVGTNTAGAILVYAYDQPVEFIETNIRSVYIDFFFSDRMSIPDSLIAEYVAATVDRESPRKWYWALMDYGSHLKATKGNAARASKSYTKQTRFQGSIRQVRGGVLRKLSEGPASRMQLGTDLSDDRLDQVMADLEREKMIENVHGSWRLHR